VQPGETVTIEARIALPDEPGNYTLELDLVHEGVAWFKESGAPTLTRWLTVEAPASQGSPRTAAVQCRCGSSPTSAGGCRAAGALCAAQPQPDSLHRGQPHRRAPACSALERIAQAHIRRGYPGIAYDFVVDAAGQILRVTDMEDVAQPDQVWSEQGVNICLAGNFGEQRRRWRSRRRRAPVRVAGAELGSDRRRHRRAGRADSPSDSPGETFYKGAAWKQVLTRQVRLHLAALGMGAVESAATARNWMTNLRELREQNAALLVQVKRRGSAQCVSARRAAAARKRCWTCAARWRRSRTIARRWAAPERGDQQPAARRGALHAAPRARFAR
jgi:hypothetical protein